MNHRKLLLSPLLWSATARAFQPLVIRTSIRPTAATSGGFLRLFGALPPDYADRAAANNFDPPSEIVQALKTPKTYVLDVRGPDEIAGSKLMVEDGVTWVTTPCSKAECPELQADPTSFLPDKDATIVVHCASGIRADTAKKTLTRLGYTKVLNGGGLKDILASLED